MDRHLIPLRARIETLFEDFDLPPAPEPPPEPEIIEPVFTASELESARQAAWQEGHEAGLTEAGRSATASAVDLLGSIRTGLDEARQQMVTLTEANAEALAHLLLESLTTTFPAACASLGDREIRAVIGTILPALHQEPRIIVRVPLSAATMVTGEIERLDPEIMSRVRIIAMETMSPGDVHIAWANGSAVRDTASLWERVAAILIPGGLIPSRQPAEKEIERVE